MCRLSPWRGSNRTNRRTLEGNAPAGEILREAAHDARTIGRDTEGRFRADARGIQHRTFHHHLNLLLEFAGTGGAVDAAAALLSNCRPKPFSHGSDAVVAEGLPQPSFVQTRLPACSD